MAIVVTLDRGEFVARLTADKYASWSVEGAEVLFDYLDQKSDVMDAPYEFDLVGLRCEYSEGTVDEIIDYYDIDVSDAADEKADIVREFLDCRTVVAGETSDGFVYAAY